ncbi:uncharacterized protein LOC123869610 [Maniola jurtina]|uniref:uncharacterized protein LOC123869610 n=1 Tax=Maniola jurtina TaxID=191418 RepID=UPI001E68C1D7|nr:uncharacterized protein LOC123869610 [Maniola jurtina]
MKTKNRSEVSLMMVQSTSKYKEEVYVPPLDGLGVEIHDLRVPDEESKLYVIEVAFFNQLLISTIVTSTGGREVKEVSNKIIATGQMNYDPSDYEKMCLFADNPLIIKIHPLRNEEEVVNTSTNSSPLGTAKLDPDTYCCTIDILPLFTEVNKMCWKKRLEPIFEQSVLLVKSWNNLPLVTITLKATRNPANIYHHKMFKNANYMKITLVGSYNMILPFEDEYIYTAASKLPLQNEMQSGMFCFNDGYRWSKRFNSMSFYPHWENLRLEQKLCSRGDEKLEISIEELQNEENIDVNYYVNEKPEQFTTLWASFHRVLMLKDTEELLTKHIREYKWPIEVHIYGENKGYSFMGFIDLFRLLYPGEKTVRLVVPLQWVDAQSMMANCGCKLLLKPSDNVPSILSAVQKPSKSTTESIQTSTTTEIIYVPRSTGSDDNCSFVIVEISLAHAIMEPCIPPHLTKSEINEMLIEMEVIPTKRKCTGRGQLDRDWQSTVQAAANALRRVPYFGLTDLCTINRQLSESRTRVELITSFWQDAAIYVNNNFVIKDFLHSDGTFEEMLMIAHACLMRLANETLHVATDNRQELSSTLRAARHARHLQDLPHAMDLYRQLVASKPREANSWRELATCLKDVDNDWANVCINKAIMLNLRHPLSLLSKGGAVFEVDPDAAEPFFTALMAFYPFYTCLWVAANAYFLHRELFHMAHEIMEQVKKTEAEGLSQEMAFPRVWEHELGDWWDHTPLLPGTSRYYETADLLLRLRAVTLAEICIARAFLETDESAVYYHMVALCCRIRGNIDDALCHIKQGIEKYGEIMYLRSLEGECYHKRKELTASMASFEKIGSCGSPYISLLSLPRRDHVRVQATLTDLTRRNPSAYAWMALADDWMMQSAMGEGGDADATKEQRAAAANAAMCALNALRCDRSAARAWSLLAILLKPSARRQYCREMAVLCGENKLLSPKYSKHAMDSQQSFCFRLGKALRECRCKMCDHLSF